MSWFVLIVITAATPALLLVYLGAAHLLRGTGRYARAYFSAKDEARFGWCVLHGIERPWSLRLFTAEVSGADNLLLYTWMGKDLSWMRGWVWAAECCGVLSLLLSALVVVRAVVAYRHGVGHRREFAAAVATFLWIAGNFAWMQGEFFLGGEDDDGSPTAPQAGIVLACGACWLLAYYAVVLPCGWLKPTAAAKALADDQTLRSPFPWLFPELRDYECAHLVFWIGKDISWNAQ